MRHVMAAYASAGLASKRGKRRPSPESQAQSDPAPGSSAVGGLARLTALVHSILRGL